MKRLFILLSIFLSMTATHAQETTDNYRPFIEEGKTWLTFQGCNYPPVIGVFWRYDYFDGDTVVAGKNCKRWRQKYVRQTTGETFLSTVSAYEEDKKVWFFYENDTLPRLYFDFGAPLYQTFDVTPPFAFMRKSLTEYIYVKMPPEEFDDYYTQSTFIYKIEEDSLGGRLQRKYNFQNGNEGDIYLKGYLLEGIGGVTSPDWNLFFFARLPVSYLIYCMTPDEVLYYDAEIAQQENAPIPDAIKELPSRRTVQSALFDLSGRRLSARPTKGLYIEDGKVRVGRKE